MTYVDYPNGQRRMAKERVARVIDEVFLVSYRPKCMRDDEVVGCLSRLMRFPTARTIAFGGADMRLQ